ncbi:MAG: XdhC family protein, partial [Deinococcus sp.]
PLGGPESGLEAAPGKLLLRGGEGLGGFRDSRLHGFALEAARQGLAARDPRAVTLRAPGGEEVFIDVNAPAPELLIYGAGHDAVPLSLQAVSLGYRVTVVDPRESYLTAGRFPGARLLPLAPEELTLGLEVSERMAAVVMNHHLDRDRVCLWHALNSLAPWVGVLGPRDRFKLLLGALEGERLHPDPAQLARVRSPVGLALGAEAPEEVALSILAELMAWRRGGSGRPLSGHEGPIHQTYLARSRVAAQVSEGREDAPTAP